MKLKQLHADLSKKNKDSHLFVEHIDGLEFRLKNSMTKNTDLKKEKLNVIKVLKEFNIKMRS